MRLNFMQTEESKKFYSSFRMYGNQIRLVNHENPLRSNSDIFIAKAAVNITLSACMDAYSANALVINLDWQRTDSWNKTDKEKLLESIRDGKEIGPLWLCTNGMETDIMDGGHRTVTTHSFMFDKPIVYSTGRKSHALKIRECADDKNVKATKFKDFADYTKENFINKILDVNIYFPIHRDAWEQIEENQSGSYNLIDMTVDLTSSFYEKEKEEFDFYKMSQFAALQGGQQMNKAEKRKTNLSTRGYLQKHLERIANEELTDITYGFTSKRSEKVEYLSKIAHVISNTIHQVSGSFEDPTEHFGKSKDKQIDDLYEMYNEENDESRYLVSTIRKTLDRLKICQEYHKKEDGEGSIITGNCYKKQSGWLLTAFFYHWVPKNYVIDDSDNEQTKNNYLLLGKVIGGLYNHYIKEESQIKIENKKRNLTYIYDRSKEQLNPIECAAVDFHIASMTIKGKGDELIKAYWAALRKMIKEYGELKEKTKREQFSEDKKRMILANQNNKSPNGNLLDIKSNNFEIHHKTPLKYGGTNNVDNLVALSPDEHKLIHSKI